ncbi:POK18 protein, partial [Eudromia elegans]|nr:POK18 protein [Eudromia elegans]
PWKYLGWIINESSIKPQKLSLHSRIRTLNDAQKLLSDLQWLRPVVGFTNNDLEPF